MQGDWGIRPNLPSFENGDLNEGTKLYPHENSPKLAVLLVHYSKQYLWINNRSGHCQQFTFRQLTSRLNS